MLKPWDIVRRQRVILVAGCAAGLSVAHLLNDFVPDALGIGVGMFCAGALSGFLAGVLWKGKT